MAESQKPNDMGRVITDALVNECQQQLLQMQGRCLDLVAELTITKARLAKALEQQKVPPA